MKIYLGKDATPIDTDQLPVVIVFKDDKERMAVAAQMAAMVKDEKKVYKSYAIYPKEMKRSLVNKIIDKAIENFQTALDFQKELSKTIRKNKKQT